MTAIQVDPAAAEGLMLDYLVFRMLHPLNAAWRLHLLNGTGMAKSYLDDPELGKEILRANEVVVDVAKSDANAFVAYRPTLQGEGELSAGDCFRVYGNSALEAGYRCALLYRLGRSVDVADDIFQAISDRQRNI